MSRNELKYYMVEEYSDLAGSDACNIVALSPQAAFSLDAKGLPYTMLDDYYCEKDLRSDEDKYFLMQLEWIDKLDNIIRNNLEFCRIHDIGLLRRIFYLPFKYIVDHTIIETRIIRSFIEKKKPEEIVYIYDSRKRKNPVNLYQWIDKGTNFYKEILSMMASKYGFSVSAVDLANESVKDDAAPLKKNNTRKVYLLIKHIAKSIYLAVKHNKLTPLFAGKKYAKDKLNVLFLHSGCEPQDFLIKDFLRKGAGIFVKENSDIFFENKFFRTKVLNLGRTDRGKESVSKIGAEIKTAMPALYTKGRLLDWVSEQCSLDITPVLKPFMEHLFLDMAVAAIIESEKIADFCKDNKIDFVIARAGTDSDPVSGLMASNCVKDIKSVCFQHGCYALDFKMLHITEAGMFDIYFASDDLSEKYFKEESPAYIKNRCVVFQEPHALRRIKRRDRVKSNNTGKVLYIPANHSFYLRYFNNLDYSATWYYRFQKEVLSFLATKNDTTFIYKHSKHGWCSESIISYIEKMEYKNIVVEDGRIPRYLPMVEKVIIDCPSTPLFEAAAFGMPVLAIFRDHMPLWKPASGFFGRSLQPFGTTAEAIEKMDLFLKSKPEEYNIRLPMHSGNTYNTLISLKGHN